MLTVFVSDSVVTAVILNTTLMQLLLVVVWAKISSGAATGQNGHGRDECSHFLSCVLLPMNLDPSAARPV